MTPVHVQRAAMVELVDTPHNQCDGFIFQLRDKGRGHTCQTVLPIGLGCQQAGPLIIFGVPSAAHQVDQRRIIVFT